MVETLRRRYAQGSRQGVEVRDAEVEMNAGLHGG